jgi:N-methylhydantoinase B/oxoprolinase/acetone carboxylase alpha subunit
VNELDTTKVEVDQMIDDLDTILMAIKRADDLIKQVTNPVTKEVYTQQMQQMIDDYKVICTYLKVLIEDYTKLEKKDGLPANLSYRRLLRKLKESQLK